MFGTIAGVIGAGKELIGAGKEIANMVDGGGESARSTQGTQGAQQVVKLDADGDGNISAKDVSVFAGLVEANRQQQGTTA